MDRLFRRIDLHLHTNRSDGQFSPQDVLLRSARGGLDFVAVTDHDLPTNLPAGEREIEGRPVFVLAGAEVSATHEGAEFHLLVYFAGAVPEVFFELCRQLLRSRVERFLAAFEALGLPPALPEAVLSLDAAFTRHHLARAVVEAGKARTLHEAFIRFVGDQGHVVPPIPLSFIEAIRAARDCGGFTSWAHPPRQAVERHVAGFVRAGLQGLEGIRPLLSSTERRLFRRTAEKHGLYLTAGSDWHGWNDPEPGLFAALPSEMKPFLSALETAGAFA